MRYFAASEQMLEKAGDIDDVEPQRVIALDVQSDDEQSLPDWNKVLDRLGRIMKLDHGRRVAVRFKILGLGRKFAMGTQSTEGDRLDVQAGWKWTERNWVEILAKIDSILKGNKMTLNQSSANHTLITPAAALRRLDDRRRRQEYIHGWLPKRDPRGVRLQGQGAFIDPTISDTDYYEVPRRLIRDMERLIDRMKLRRMA